MFDELFESLQYTGLGGKKSSGWEDLNVGFVIFRENERQLTQKASLHLLLSTALPEDEELEDILKGATYMFAQKKWIYRFSNICRSANAKSDIYVFSAGSCFVNTF